MSPELIELARRAVACKGWRWMPGMVTVPPFARRLSAADLALSLHDEKALPDLTDPATVGCLLALVREAHNDPTYLPTCLQEPPDEAWVVNRPQRQRQTRYESEAEALVAALEAAS